MSVDLKAVPPWKQALIEKKRRPDHDDRRSSNKEADQISSLPSWKRDILSKKQHTRNSHVFLSDKHTQAHIQSNTNRDSKEAVGNDIPQLKLTNSSSSSCGNAELRQNKENSSNGDEEHIISVGENPWLKADSAYARKKSKSNRHSDPMSDIQLNHVSNNHSWSETDGVHDTQHHSELNDDVFREEVTYGRGFVHKLLQRFSHMSSTKEEEDKNKLKKPYSGRISRSSENLLDEKSGSKSPRAFSPTDHVNNSLSPRSPTRSRSSDSLTSPRSLTSERTDTSSGNKMGYADKTALSTSNNISQGHGNEYHSDISHESGLNSFDIEDKTDNSENNNLPKNIVATARNVFENYISAQPCKKPVLVSPRGHSSKSVHRLIAVDTLGDDEGPNVFESLPSSPPVIENESINDVNKKNSGYNSSSAVVSTTKKSPDEPAKSRSWYFSGNRKSWNKPGDSNESGKSPSSDSKNAHDKNANEMNFFSEKDISKYNSSNLEKAEVQSPDSPGVKFKHTYLSQSSTGISQNNQNSGPQNSSVVNGHVSNSVSDKVSSPGESFYPLKKRKAPSPPNQTKSEHETDNKKHVTSVILDNSNKPVIKNTQENSDHKKETSTTIKTSNIQRTNNLSESKNDLLTKKSEASRHKLSLNLNHVSNTKVESNHIVNSKPVKENPSSVIYNRNKKSKFKVPKTTGPGSLLIRPASNMVHGKNAQFVSLEFKYKDIKKGDFAPAKKRPAYYDEYSDEESDEDIPVTNIDDVIAGGTVVNGESRSAPRKTKEKKYDFIGQGVIMDKSCIKSRKIKMNITFADHATQTYEYPSQQSLLDSLPAEPGDFDHPDTVYNVVSTPSDEEIPDMEEPSSTLKSTPGVGSGGSLAGYQTKMQVEFNFGMNPMEPVAQTRNGNTTSKDTQKKDETDSIIKPADEEDTFQWSENKTSDLLF